MFSWKIDNVKKSLSDWDLTWQKKNILRSVSVSRYRKHKSQYMKIAGTRSKINFSDNNLWSVHLDTAKTVIKFRLNKFFVIIYVHRLKQIDLDLNNERWAICSRFGVKSAEHWLDGKRHGETIVINFYQMYWFYAIHLIDPERWIMNGYLK